jgi:hypothetical protein
MTRRQRSEEPGRGEPAVADVSEQPTVALLTPEELAERRARERQGRRRSPGSMRPPRDASEARERPRRAGGQRRVPGAAFAVSGAVAAAFVALALADGGFEPRVWAEATILVWWTVVLAILVRAWPRSPIPRAALAAGGALLALAGLAALSLGWTTDLGAAYEDAMRGAGYLGIFVLTAIAARAGYGRAFLAGLAVGLVAVCVISLLSRLEPGLVESQDEAQGLRVSGGRLSWPLGYWNALGACAAAALPLLVWLAASAGAAWRRALAASAIPVILLTLFFSGSRGGQIASSAAIVVLLLAGPRRVTLISILALGYVAATVLIGAATLNPELVNGEENAAAASAGDVLLVMTIVAAIVVAGVMMLADRRVARAHLPVIGARRAAVVLGVVAVLAVVTADPVDRLRSFDDPPATTQATDAGTRLQAEGSSGRAQFWDAALTAFADEPGRGIGAGGFESYWAANGTLDFTVVHAHSLFFESAAELGLAGLLLAVVLFAAPAVAAVRRLLAPTSWAGSETATGAVGAALAVLAAGALVAAVDWSWDLPAAFLPVVVAAAYLCVPPGSGRSFVAAGAGRRRRRAPDGHPALRVGTAVAVVAVAAVAIAGSVLTILYDDALGRSEAALAAGDLGEAAKEARVAGDRLPFAAEPRRQLALVENARERPEAARRAIADAQSLAAGDWQLWLIEAGIDFSDGRLGRGLYALNRAQALNPKAPVDLFVAPASSAG